ncbi:hypothetical protein FGG78_41070, partial [Thioclava sp. BHET1]
YMDCDMLVIGSLDEVWAASLDENTAVAAVACPSPTPEYLAAINIQAGEYINSGLLLMNLTYWRQYDVGRRCVEALTSEACPYLSEDESAINDICRGHIRYLPRGFNVYVTLDYQEIYQDLREAVVLHYVGPLKPWLVEWILHRLWDREYSRISRFAPVVSRKASVVGMTPIEGPLVVKAVRKINRRRVQVVRFIKN